VIILDTNVLSALMQATSDVRVVAWLDRQAPESIWTTSITLFESRLGLALLPEGRRRQALEASFEQLLKKIYKTAYSFSIRLPRWKPLR